MIKKHVMKAALKRGVDSGMLVQLKHSYKISAEAKKAPKAAKKPVSKVAKEIKKKVNNSKHLRSYDCFVSHRFHVFC